MFLAGLIVLHRRSFLHPRQLARSVGNVLGAVAELTDLVDLPAAQPTEPTLLLRSTYRAMATKFELFLPYGLEEASATTAVVFDLIDELEAQLTVYRETSEVARLNRRAAIQPVQVEARLFELLQLASRIHQEAGGAYDISTGALIKAWGFFKGPRRVPDEATRLAALARSGMQHVRLDPETRTVSFDRPGIELNLGSIGKGYALDRAAELLRQRGDLQAALLHGGHSSVYAIGTQPGDPGGWTIGIDDPRDPKRRMALVRLRDRALGTSAKTVQYLEHHGRRLGHILDPRSGWSAEGMASVTVLAPTAAEADALATAFFVLGVAAARSYCEKRPDIGMVLLPEGSAAPPTVLGLGPNDYTLLVSHPGETSNA